MAGKTPREQIGVDLPEPPPPEPEMVEEEPEAPERPEWLPDKFDKPEDLASSYAELERARTEDRQRLSELEQYVASQQAQAQQYEQYDTEDYETQKTQLEQAFEDDPVGTMQWLAAQAAQSVYQQQQQQAQPFQQQQLTAYQVAISKMADDDLKNEISDWTEVAPKIAQAIEQDPNFIDVNRALSQPDPYQGIKEELVKAYKLVRADEYLSNEQQLREAGVSPEEVARAYKMQHQTLQGSAARAQSNVDPATAKLESLRRSLDQTWQPQVK